MVTITIIGYPFFYIWLELFGFQLVIYLCYVLIIYLEAPYYAH